MIRTFATVADFLLDKSTLAGDSGSDTLAFSAAVNFNDATLAGMNAATVDGNTKIEVLTLSDGISNQVTLAGNASLVGFQSVFGGLSADRIIASSYPSGMAVSLFGGDGNDTLAGGAEADRLEGGVGNDSLSGGNGNNTLDGGAGIGWFDGEIVSRA